MWWDFKHFWFLPRRVDNTILQVVDKVSRKEKTMAMKAKRGTIVLLSLLAVSVLMSGCWPNNKINTAKTGEATHFTLGIIQDGRKIPIENNQVTLEKKPFTIVFHFSQLGSMLVQASSSPNLIDQARRGSHIDQLLGEDNRIPEDNMNPDGILYVSEKGQYHNWLYLGPQVHRFDRNGVEKVRDGGYVCRRTVQRLFIQGRELPIEKCPNDNLYLLLIKTQRSAGSGRRGELQRDWLEINFIP